MSSWASDQIKSIQGGINGQRHARRQAESPAALKAASRKANARRAIRPRRAPKKLPSRSSTSAITTRPTSTKGLRTYAKYRDLGLALADRRHGAGACHPFHSAVQPARVSTPHFHDVDLQMIYVLKGWYKTEFEGEGVHRLVRAPAGATAADQAHRARLLPTIAGAGDRAAGGVRYGDAEGVSRAPDAMQNFLIAAD